MHALKARIENGRYVIDEMADLPDGTEVYLIPLDDEEEERLDVEAADRAVADAKANGEEPVPWAKVKVELGL